MLRRRCPLPRRSRSTRSASKCKPSTRRWVVAKSCGCGCHVWSAFLRQVHERDERIAELEQREKMLVTRLRALDSQLSASHLRDPLFEDHKGRSSPRQGSSQSLSCASFVCLDESIVKLMTSSGASSRDASSASIVNSVAKLMDVAGSVTTPVDSPYSTTSSRTLSNASCCNQSEDPLVSMEATAADRALTAAASAAEILNATDIVGDAALNLEHDEPLGACVLKSHADAATTPVQQLFVSHTHSPVQHVINVRNVRITPNLPQHSNANFVHSNRTNCAVLTSASAASDNRKLVAALATNSHTSFSPTIKRLRILYRTGTGSPPVIASRSCTLTSPAQLPVGSSSLVCQKTVVPVPGSPVITIRPRDSPLRESGDATAESLLSPLHADEASAHVHEHDLDTNIAHLSKLFSYDPPTCDHTQVHGSDVSDLDCAPPSTHNTCSALETPVPLDVTRDFVTHAHSGMSDNDTLAEDVDPLLLRDHVAASVGQSSSSMQSLASTAAGCSALPASGGRSLTSSADMFERQKSPLISLKLPPPSTARHSRERDAPKSKAARVRDMGDEPADEVALR